MTQTEHMVVAAVVTLPSGFPSLLETLQFGQEDKPEETRKKVPITDLDSEIERNQQTSLEMSDVAGVVAGVIDAASTMSQWEEHRCLY